MGKRAGAAAVRSAAQKKASADKAKDGSRGEDMFEHDDKQMQRSIFPSNWIMSNEEEMTKTMGMGKICDHYGVPRRELEHYLEQQVKRQKICNSLPFTGLMTLTYFMVVINHDDAAAMSAVEDSLAFDIADNANFADVQEVLGFKGFYDINSDGDFWSWLSNGVIPLLFDQAGGIVESEGGWLEHMAEEDPEWEPPPLDFHNITVFGMFLHYNRLIGGFRLSQERYDEPDYVCETSALLLPAYGIPCVGGHGPYELDPEIWDARSTSDIDRKMTEWFFFDQTKDGLGAMEERVLRLELSGWVDNRTQKIEVAMPVYNAEYGIHSLIHVNLFFSRGGHIWKAIIPMSVFANWFDSPRTILCDVVFCGSLIWMIYVQVDEILTMVKTKGFYDLVEEYYNFWNIMEWVSIYVAIALLIMAGFNIMFLGDVNSASEGVAESFLAGNWTLYQNGVVNDFMPKLENAVHYNHKFRLIMAGYPCVIVFRLFKVYSAQPRLAVVTQSIERGSIDLFHFLVVFVSIMMIYCISAVVLYGRATDEFATLERTMYATFLIMLGIFDWETMSVVGRIEAGIWLWTFMIIVSLVLLNMLLAIILDSYEMVKEEAGSTLTLFQDLNKMRKRKMGEHSGVIIPNMVVLKGIREHMKELAIAKKDLQDLLDEMTEDKKINAQGQVWNNKERSWDECPDELRLDKTDWVIEFITPDILGEMVGSKLHTSQARQLIEHAVQGFYDRNYSEPELEKLRSCSENLLFHMKEWKEEVFVNPYDAVALRLPDVTFSLRAKVTPIWKALNCGPDYTLEGRSFRAMDNEIKAQRERDEEEFADIVEDFLEHDGSGPTRRTAKEVVVAKGEVDHEGDMPAWKQRSLEAHHGHGDEELELHLEQVRVHVAERLSIVSTLQWEISRVRSGRRSLEDTTKVLKDRASSLIRENRVFKERLYADDKINIQDEEPTYAEEADLLRRLTGEHRLLTAELERMGGGVADGALYALDSRQALALQNGASDLRGAGSMPMNPVGPERWRHHVGSAASESGLSSGSGRNVSRSRTMVERPLPSGQSAAGWSGYS